MIRRSERLILNITRSIPITKKMPTPTEIVSVRMSIISAFPERSATCFAKICRSGSEMVTKIPMRKLTSAMSHILFDFARYEPIFEPIVCIDISAPIVKSDKPKMRHTTPKTKSRKMPGSIGVSVIANAATISAMGIMDVNDSESLDLIRFCNCSCSFPGNREPFPLILYYNILKCGLQVLFVVFQKNSYLFIIYFCLCLKIGRHLQFIHF